MKSTVGHLILNDKSIDRCLLEIQLVDSEEYPLDGLKSEIVDIKLDDDDIWLDYKSGKSIEVEFHNKLTKSGAETNVMTQTILFACRANLGLRGYFPILAIDASC
jgi:hypothetical protein